MIRDAMRGKEMVGLGRVVLAKRERVIMLQPWEKGLMGTTLRYAYEVRPAAEYFDDIADVKISSEMLKLAEHILETKADEFDPATFVDHYEEAVVKMLQQKQSGVAVPKEKSAEAPRNVINLMDALRRSVARRQGQGAAAEKAAPKAARCAKKGKKRAEGQREMLSADLRQEEGSRQGAGEARGAAQGGLTAFATSLADLKPIAFNCLAQTPWRRGAAAGLDLCAPWRARDDHRPPPGPARETRALGCRRARSNPASQDDARADAGRHRREHVGGP